MMFYTYTDHYSDKHLYLYFLFHHNMNERIPRINNKLNLN